MLKPGFEQVSSKAPTRSSVPDPKRTWDCAFRSMAAQSSGWYSERLGSLGKTDGPSLV
jgi:hypothetical protein